MVALQGGWGRATSLGLETALASQLRRVPVASSESGPRDASKQATVYKDAPAPDRTILTMSLVPKFRSLCEDQLQLQTAGSHVQSRFLADSHFREKVTVSVLQEQIPLLQVRVNDLKTSSSPFLPSWTSHPKQELRARDRIASTTELMELHCLLIFFPHLSL